MARARHVDMRVISGLQPTGRLHLGNYFGAVAPTLGLAGTGNEVLLFVADLHALTTTHDGALLQERSMILARELIALAGDAPDVFVFRQSEVVEVTLLGWLLTTLAPLGLLQRGHSFKDKLQRGSAPTAGLLAYPTLMAADVMAYDADLVPVGKDQLQHLEMARDLLAKLERAYGAEVVRLPRPFLIERADVVPGIDGQKMSKSRGNTLELFAPRAQVAAQVRRIKTDSTPPQAPKPVDAPLWRLLELVAAAPAHQRLRGSWERGGVGYAAYKEELLLALEQRFAATRARFEELDQERVEVRLASGAERARGLAAIVMSRLRKAAGLAPQ